MNPFALHGGDFLIFYALCGIAGLGILFIWIRQQEGARVMPQLQMTDPYQIAYLRGGTKEALRVAAFSLIDRGLLSAGGKTLLSEAAADRRVRRPIEKAVLSLYLSPGGADAMKSDSRANEACREYRDTLEDFGLVAGAGTFGRRLIPFAIVTMILVFIGVLKILIALSEGRSNIGLTVLMLIAFTAVAIMIFRRHRTKLGDAMLADLRVMFGRLRDRADTLRQGGATNEAALLAAVYGISELSPDRFPGVEALKPAKDNSGSFCGSSCSSCGGGCGGGCGG